MGAWGFEPLDSDQALDWMGDTLDPIADKIRELLDRFKNEDGRYFNEHEIRAAAHLFCATNLDFHCARKTDAQVEGGNDMRSDLIDALTSLYEDEDWINEWSDPEAVKASLDRQIKALAEPEAHDQPRSTTLMENLGVDSDTVTLTKRHEVINAALEQLKSVGIMAAAMMPPGGDISKMILRYEIPISDTQEPS